MAAWHRSRGADIGLRMAGILLCVVAWGVFARMTARTALAGSTGPGAFVSAAIGFLAASAGSAMAMLGRHLFDEIPVGPQATRSFTIDTYSADRED